MRALIAALGAISLIVTPVQAEKLKDEFELKVLRPCYTSIFEWSKVPDASRAVDLAIACKNGRRDSFWKQYPRKAIKRVLDKCHTIDFDKYWNSDLEFKKLKSSLKRMGDADRTLKKRGEPPAFGPESRNREFDLKRMLCELGIRTGLLGKQ